MDSRTAARLLHDLELRLAFAVGEAERRRGVPETPERAGRTRRSAQRHRHGGRAVQR